jgi:hypothetical protein
VRHKTAASVCYVALSELNTIAERHQGLRASRSPLATLFRAFSATATVELQFQFEFTKSYCFMGTMLPKKLALLRMKQRQSSETTLSEF